MKTTQIGHTTTVAQFLALLRDQTIDVVEMLATGVYKLGNISVSGIDRTARPLTIRPASGAKIIWNGDGKQNTPAFYFGYPTIAPAVEITLDGRNGIGSSWLFTNYNVGFVDAEGKAHGTGVIWIGGSHHLRFRGLTFSGNTGTPVGQNSHTFYISNNSYTNDGRSHDIEIGYCTIDGGGRQLTGSQCFHPPGPYNVDFHDNVVRNCTSGCVWGTGGYGLEIRSNTFTDCNRAISVDGPQGIASGNTSHNAPAVIKGPFVDDGTNKWG